MPELTKEFTERFGDQILEDLTEVILDNNYCVFSGLKLEDLENIGTDNWIGDATFPHGAKQIFFEFNIRSEHGTEVTFFCEEEPGETEPWAIVDLETNTSPEEASTISVKLRDEPRPIVFGEHKTSEDPLFYNWKSEPSELVFPNKPIMPPKKKRKGGDKRAWFLIGAGSFISGVWMVFCLYQIFTSGGF